MKPWLNTKTAGLPRWAWAALLAGGLAIGLYIHAANSVETEGEEETEELPSGRPQSLESYEGTETGGGLQALGVAGPTPQATVPVESPFIPEGFPETLGGQGDVIQGLANGVLEQGLASTELASALAERPQAEREVIREKMVGHAPERKPHHQVHKKKHAKPKKKEPTQHKKKKKHHKKK
jgi:hypothetical protein